MVQRNLRTVPDNVESAVNDRVFSWLDVVRPRKSRPWRSWTLKPAHVHLIGLLAHLQVANSDVRQAILSPSTITLMKDIGLDVFSQSA